MFILLLTMLKHLFKHFLSTISNSKSMKNIGFVFLNNCFLIRGLIQSCILINICLLSAFLKLKIDHHAGICANVNIDFQIPHDLCFPRYNVLVC